MADSRATPPRARGDLSVLPRCKWSGPGELADGSLQLPTAAGARGRVLWLDPLTSCGLCRKESH